MRYIIHDPIITDNSITVKAELEGDPEACFSVTETGVNHNDLDEKLWKLLSILARKIANHKLGHITWK